MLDFFKQHTIDEIDADQLRGLLLSPATHSFIDVRESEEWEASHIDGFTHIPLGVLPEKMSELDKTKTHYVICASGRRSAHACELLSGSGFRAVNVRGGINAWKSAGLPVRS